MAQHWAYNVSLRQLVIGAVVILSTGIILGMISTFVFILTNLEGEIYKSSCYRGKPWPPSEAVVYKPLLIRINLDNSTESKNPYREQEIIASTYAKSHTIIIDCETSNPFWWSPDGVLELLHLMELEENETDRFVPDFWIRKAISGNTNDVNTTACQQLIDYAVNNSLTSFQGVLLEASQLLSLNTELPDQRVAVQTIWQHLKNSIEETKPSRGYKLGLLLIPEACYGLHKVVPEGALSKFDKIFYLENQMEIQLSEGTPVVSTSLEFEHCANNLSGDVTLQLVLSDVNNVFGNTNTPICILNG